MSLSTKSVGATGESNSTYIKEGVFVEQVRIQMLKETSGQQLDWMTWSNDLSIYAELEGERELPFTPSFYVGGDFKRENGKIKSWGGAFLVASFFKTLLGADFDLTDENRIPTDVLQAAQGQTFLKVSFRSTKPKSNGDDNKILDWNRIVVQGEDETLQEAKERAADLFIEDYISSGYPAAYDRAGAIANDNGQSRDATPAGDGASMSTASGGGGPQSNFAAESDPDELPF